MQASTSRCSAKLRLTTPGVLKHPASLTCRHRSTTAKGKRLGPSYAVRRAEEIVGRIGRPWQGQPPPPPSSRPSEFKFIQDIIQSEPWSTHVPAGWAGTRRLTADEVAERDPLPRDVRVGSLLEIRRHRDSIKAIFLYESEQLKRRTIAVLDSMGQLSFVYPEDITFVLPNFIADVHAQRIGLNYSPGSRNELMARVVATKKIRDFVKSYQDVYNSTSRLFTNIYDKIAPEDPEEWGVVTVSEVLRRVGLRENILSSFAAQNFLMDRSQEFIAQQTDFLSSRSFHVRPRAQVQRLNALNQKMVNGDPDFAAQEENSRTFLDRFGERARSIIASLRTRTKNVEHESPSRSTASDITFSEDDRLVIGVLLDSLYSLRSLQVDPYESVVPEIIKAVGLEDTRITADHHRTLLIDLGVLAPWQDTVTRRWDIISGGHNTRTGARDAVKATKPLSPPRSTLSSQEFYVSDIVESLRHDFGGMPAYVIDDYGAKELDDGLSVERDSQNPDHIWLHVHVADPTRLIHPGHEFARKAARAQESMYFINKTWPMLPDSFMKGQSVSLGSGGGKPETVLTFSGKISPDGEMVDYRVRAGVINKVRVLRYNDVDATLGFPQDQPLLPFGDSTRPFNVLLLPEQDKENLNLLRNATQRLFHARLNSAHFQVSAPRAAIAVSPQPLPDSFEGSSHPGVFRGWPDMRYEVDLVDCQQGSRRIVAEAAKMACRIGSRFGADRGVPLIRRAQRKPIEKRDGDMEALRALKDEFGMAPWKDVITRSLQFPAAYTTLKPDAHWSLGVQDGVGYARVTSPLRRYTDMLHHWQIKHALLNPNRPPLFSANELQAVLDTPTSSLVPIKGADRMHAREWITMYLHRYMALHPVMLGGEGPGPLQSLEAVVVGERTNTFSTQDVYAGYIPRLGIPTDILTDPGVPHPELTIGSTHRVDIDNVSIALRGRVSVRLRK